MAAGEGRGKRGEGDTPQAEASSDRARAAREARLAQALRTNLRRRKAPPAPGKPE